MIIWFNDKGFRCNAKVRQSSDSRILTLTAENLNKSVSEIAKMLEGETEIRLCDDSNILTGAYKSVGLAAIAMEQGGGGPVLTATLYARRIGEDEADRLYAQIRMLNGMIVSQDRTIESQLEKLTAQEETIVTLREGLTSATGMAEMLKAALQAMEEGAENA